jgi:phage baseplate assembly protein W
MRFEIQTSDSPSIDWAAKGADEIVQNVFNLLNTGKYEVAYDRTLGISRDFVDMPLTEAVALVTAQIYDVIAEREPRANVEEVTFTGVSDTGDLNFKVVIEV